MKNRLMICLVLVLAIPFIFLATIAAADLQPTSWSKTGIGTTTIAQNDDSSLRFTYNVVSTAVYDGEWWTLTSTATATETFDFIYRYNCFHAWFRTTAQLIAFADGPDGTQRITLYSGSGTTTQIGTSSLEVTEGYSFGFQIYASNFDSNAIAQGSLDIYNNDPFIINFDSAGGSSVPSITQDYGTSVSAPADPTREGYTFAGWSPAIPATMPAGGAALTAQWTINEYTIDFDSSGGSIVPSITQDYSTSLSTPADPTREGFTFAGWNPAVPGTMPAGDATLTAQWTINEYTIDFDSAGGSSVASITQDYGTSVSAPADPTREGFTFAGWNPAVPGTMPAGDATLTAQWTINEYTIDFDSAGGSSVASITQDYGTSVSAPADPTRKGYTFAGWNPAVPETMPAGDATLTAQWTAKKYTIVFDVSGGSSVASITQAYGTSVSAPAAPIRNGYTFGGWNPAVPETVPDGDVTLTAQWTINEYQVVFMNGDKTPLATQTVPYGSSAIPPANPSREGSSFIGWDQSYENVSSDLILIPLFTEEIPATGEVSKDRMIGIGFLLAAAGLGIKRWRKNGLSNQKLFFDA